MLPVACLGGFHTNQPYVEFTRYAVGPYLVLVRFGAARRVQEITEGGLRVDDPSVRDAVIAALKAAYPASARLAEVV